VKKILITGANSYIGISVSNWLAKYPDQYQVDTVDTFNDAWKQADFTKYDVVYHVAGIAHVKETKKNKPLYYQVNRDLPIAIAQHAKENGVKQFILMSSMSIYGMDTGVITKETLPKPKTNYGKSKLQAEEGVYAITDESFHVMVLRPPMVYGKGCRGNFQSFIKLVKRLPLFPRVDNQRSMIYIDNLCAFIKLSVDRELSGLYFPQNKEYMNTTEMAKWIAESLGKKVYLSWFLGFGVKALQPFVAFSRKAFGTLVYQNTEVNDYCYSVLDTVNSVKESILGEKYEWFKG
jgi:UDP-glucose 4-epimerase